MISGPVTIRMSLAASGTAWLLSIVLSEHIAPFGSWRSPITADLILADTVFGGAPGLAIDDGTVYWEEARHQEQGRTTVVRQGTGGGVEEITPAPFDVRSRVHSYGGGAFAVADGIIYFSNKTDDRIYRTTRGETPVAITPDDKRRYADLVVDRINHRLLAVCEDHRPSDREPIATIVSIDLDAPNRIEVLAEGHDFFAWPTPSVDGQRLAFVAWDHPNMPWDETALFVREHDGRTTCIAHDPNVSVAEPRWAPDGSLHYVSDKSGYWNLMRSDGPAYGPKDAELTRPHWMFGTRGYDFLPDGRVVAAYVRNGVWRVAAIDPDTDRSTDIDLPYGEVFRLRTDGEHVHAVVGGADRPCAVVKFSPTEPLEIIRQEIELALDPNDLSMPESIVFEQGGVRAFADFYPPKNKSYAAPENERPPLIVLGHGGPTSSAGKRLDLGGVQFWTSRGFAVAKVDYRGSTGYGTAYRRALDGGWGAYDVEDCVNAARHLSDAGRVDGGRMAIVGGSAGGLTVLAALAFYDVFRAGVSYYGISDLELLAEETHKFESRYVDRLIAPFQSNRELYRRRSPIHHVEKITAPVLFFQGADDKVVPPNQAELMVEKLRAHAIPAEYVLFEGEGHGFRRADTRRQCLETQLDFFRRVFDVVA